MKKVLRVLVYIVLTLLLLLCLLFAWILKDDTGAVLLFSLLAVWIGVCLWLVGRKRKTEARLEKGQPGREEAQLEKNQPRERKGLAYKQPDKDDLLCKGKFPVLAGLPLPEGTKCKISFLRSKVVIEGLGQEFTLATEKLVDVSTMKQSEVQKQFVSGAGGAIAGAMLLGPVGALLGGGVKEKTIRQIHRFLIFAYKDADDETIKYLIFQETDWGSGTGEFVSAFKKLKKREGREKIKYEL